MFISKPQVEKPYERKMDDISCIIQESVSEGGLWLGNIQAANDRSLLDENNIGAILSVCPVTLDTRNIHHFVVPAQDVDDYNLSEHFAKAIEFIDKHRKFRRGVLVHCQAGISRSVTIVLAYLVQHLIIGVKEALDMVEKKRWQVYPNNGFLKQLVIYEKNFFKQLEIKHRQRPKTPSSYQETQLSTSYLWPSPEKSTLKKQYAFSDYKDKSYNRLNTLYNKDITQTNLKDSIVLGRYIRN